MKLFLKIASALLIALFITSLFFIDYEACLRSSNHMMTLRHNIVLSTNVISKLMPLAIVLFLLYIVMKVSKAVIKIERLNVGGFNILFEKP